MKRGQSGLSCVIGIDKPLGMSSHDVVNRVRRIFEEKRVGHAGTLDPQAEGVLPILIGPATRLDRYLTGHRKTYLARIEFGTSTTTDDAEGEVIKSAPLTSDLYDSAYARCILEGFVGPQKQIPPVYSAIKVNGVRSYAASRKGNVIDLEPRDIEVFTAKLVNIDESGDRLVWEVLFDVSKGTYIRALARDIGNRAGVPAHLCGLSRRSVGDLTLGECVTLDALCEVGVRASLDPVKLLGYPVAFVNEHAKRAFQNGNRLNEDSLSLFEYPLSSIADDGIRCACTSGLHEMCGSIEDGMLVSVVEDNTLKAIYSFSENEGAWKPDCVFNIGVSRGLCV